jgi:hypothetical protein
MPAKLLLWLIEQPDVFDLLEGRYVFQRLDLLTALSFTA